MKLWPPKIIAYARLRWLSGRRWRRGLWSRGGGLRSWRRWSRRKSAGAAHRTRSVRSMPMWAVTVLREREWERLVRSVAVLLPMLSALLAVMPAVHGARPRDHLLLLALTAARARRAGAARVLVVLALWRMREWEWRTRRARSLTGVRAVV